MMANLFTACPLALIPSRYERMCGSARRAPFDSSVQWLRHMLRWLLLFVPVTIGLEFLSPQSHTLIFAASCLAILPLAGWLGDATEQLAHHTGEGIGGLLNATFGNAAE